MTRQELYQSITTRLREHLDRGYIPWRKTWSTSIPYNQISKRYYQGINFLMLSMEEFPSPSYLTFLQCNKLGGKINLGSKGIPIIYWSIKESTNVEEDSKAKSYPFLRLSHVFNLSQTSLYQGTDSTLQVCQCEEIVSHMKNPPAFSNNTSRCAYIISEDRITIPPISDFTCKEEYYSSLFHELVHTTGHGSRLNRLPPDHSKHSYAFEELVAEFGSSFLCGLCGISQPILENQAGYIQGWIKLLDDEPNVFIQASTQAAKAVDYIVS